MAPHGPALVAAAGCYVRVKGKVDLYIGPKAPAGQTSNWLYTPAGQKWFPWFRVYGPEKAIFDKSWRLPDIERIN
jgi:hypothetical protein